MKEVPVSMAFTIRAPGEISGFAEEALDVAKQIARDRLAEEVEEHGLMRHVDISSVTTTVTEKSGDDGAVVDVTATVKFLQDGNETPPTT